MVGRRLAPCLDHTKGDKNGTVSSLDDARNKGYSARKIQNAGRYLLRISVMSQLNLLTDLMLSVSKRDVK